MALVRCATKVAVCAGKGKQILLQISHCDNAPLVETVRTIFRFEGITSQTTGPPI